MREHSADVGRGSMTVSLDEPLPIVALDNLTNHLPHFAERVEIVQVQTLLFQRPDPPFPNPVALGVERRPRSGFLEVLRPVAIGRPSVESQAGLAGAPDDEGQPARWRTAVCHAGRRRGSTSRAGPRVLRQFSACTSSCSAPAINSVPPLARRMLSHPLPEVTCVC